MTGPTQLESARTTQGQWIPAIQQAAGQTNATRIQRSIVVQIALCAVPSMALLTVGQLFLSSLAFYGALGLLVVYHGFLGRPVHVTAIVVGVAPLLAMMRSTLSHNSVAVILAGALSLWVFFSLRDALRLLDNLLVTGMLVAGVTYWWSSFIITGRYAQNFRIFDLILSAVLVFLLSRYRSFLVSALLGLSVSLVTMAIALGRSGYERLGMSWVGDFSIGSPIHLALPAVLIVVCSLADEGRWIVPGLPNIWRYSLIAMAGAILIMTTSRTNWSIAVLSLGVLFLFQPRIRKHVIFSAATIFLVILVILVATPRGEMVKKYFDKVASSERTIAQKTTGRWDQYTSFPEFIADSPLLGQGPGAARESYRKSDGSELVMHSMYLHIGVELGLLGLSALLVFLATLGMRCLRHRSFTGETLPVIACFCFAAEGFANNNFNPIMGLFLGLALMSMDLDAHCVQRSAEPQTVSAGHTETSI